MAANSLGCGCGCGDRVEVVMLGGRERVYGEESKVSRNVCLARVKKRAREGEGGMRWMCGWVWLEV